jgi:hypothetical protein
MMMTETRSPSRNRSSPEQPHPTGAREESLSCQRSSCDLNEDVLEGRLECIERLNGTRA